MGENTIENGQDIIDFIVYKVNIEMKQKTIKTENETHNLTAGMAVTAEIKTGKRRIIEYITEPITESIDETIHLR